MRGLGWGCYSCVVHVYLYIQETCDAFEGHLTVKTDVIKQPVLLVLFPFLRRISLLFSGADLLKLTKEDLVQICGAADGIRLYNSLKSR